MNVYKSSFLCFIAAALLMHVIHGYPSRRHHTRDHQRALDALDEVFTVMESENTPTAYHRRHSRRGRGRRDVFPSRGIHLRRTCVRIMQNRESYSARDVRTCYRYLVHIDAINVDRSDDVQEI